jgi:hypothetical protein
MVQSNDKWVHEIPDRGSMSEANAVLPPETGSEASQAFDATSNGNDDIGENDSLEEDVDENFKNALEEQEQPSLDTLDSLDEDSDTPKERVGFGLLLRVAGAGIASLVLSVSTRLGRSAANDEDDLDVVLAEAVDVDDFNTGIALGSHADKASIQSTGNAFGAPNVPSSTPMAPPPGVESAA